ncbi:MAG: glycoside hydrolase family 2 protein [Puniceicoccaceae bacterium]
MESLSLNQPWQFRQDPDNVGLTEGWHKSGFDFASGSIEIVVPSCWEETFEDYEGVGWYATSVNVCADKAGQVCRLMFAAANYRTTVWVNGHEAGTNEGGYTPFEFQIEQYLDYGSENAIVVRIVSPIVTKALEVDGLGPNDMPHWRGGLTAGIWQPVQLAFNKSAWIADAFYKPDMAGGLFRMELTVNSMADTWADVVISLTDSDGKPACTVCVSTKLLQGTNQVGRSLVLENPIPWTCQNPHLYTATVTITFGSEPVARSVSRIGLREFTYEKERFYLNGEPIYLRGGFWEGVYAVHQSYPADRDVIRKEIELAKAAGLNLLRPWRRPVPPMILEEADAAGLLVIASPAIECMSCWPTITPEMPQRVEHEIRELILRDRNHPCIIWWEMFNEVTRKEMAALIGPMSRMAHELDPTRLVLDESGGWADGAHFYLPNSEKIESLTELHSYVRAPVSDYFWQLYQDLGKRDIVEGKVEIQKDSGIFVSEFGFGGLPEFEENCRLFEEHGNPKLPAYRHHHKILKDLRSAMETCGLDEIYPDIDSFCRDSQSLQARGNLRMADALLSNPNVSGYCLHAFTDGDWILGAGIIDHWQRPKAVYRAIQQANQVPRLLCFPKKRNLEPGESVTCNIVLRGENAPLPTSISLKGQSTVQQISSLDWSDGNDYRHLSIELSESLLSQGTNHINLEAMNETGGCIGLAEIEIFVVPTPVVVQEHPLVVYDPENLIMPWLGAIGCDLISLQDWFGQKPATFLFVPDDVETDDHLPMVSAALAHVKKGLGSAIFLQPPASHESPWMLKNYEADGSVDLEHNRLYNSGTFPWKLTCRSSFALWESAMHIAKKHPVFEGLPTGCVMDEPYHEVAPVESFHGLESDEAPVQTITWFRPEVVETKAKKRTYLGGEDLWHGTDLAVKAHGKGSVILSTLILRRKVGRDPVAALILGNLLNYADNLACRDTAKAISTLD